MNTAQSEQPKKLEETERGLNMDDILTGGQTVEVINELKSSTADIFETASLKLHKWNSNVNPLGEETSLNFRRRNLPQL